MNPYSLVDPVPEGHGYQLVIELTEEAGYRCLSCQEYSDEVLDEKLYECKPCGIVFPESEASKGIRCPECKTPGTLLGELTCTVCAEGVAEEIALLECPFCLESFPTDIILDHVKSDCTEG